ncbi:hypothetical protein C0991_008249 [Blastosporella zonata]|nr:hypothetical protein C0991_008249 [Blastosporella zonata]
MSPEKVQNLLRQLDHKTEENLKNTSDSKLSKVFRKVFEALGEYNDMIKTLISADPMPTALIWGGLNVIINSANRHYELLSSVQSHLQQMGDIIKRLTHYELLYASQHNSTLQDLLCESYICVFELFSRVHREINKSRLQATVSSTSTKCIRKLDVIIENLRKKEESIRHHVQILQGEHQHDWRREQIANSSSPVLYHFYLFDQPFKAGDILLHFASQLFHTLLSSPLCSYDMLQGIKKITADANTFVGIRAKRIIQVLIERLEVFSPVWVFLDGLDEEMEKSRWKEARPVLDFLLDLSRSTTKVRLWSSSQNVECVQDTFKDYESINIESGMRLDVENFLITKIKELDLSEEIQELLKDQFEDGASGGFLWANMLIDDLELASSPADKEIGELQEALAILQEPKNNIQNMQHSQLPYVSAIKRICAPLIVFKAEEDQTDERMEVCHLYHSAVLRFLRETPVIFIADLGGRMLDHQITSQVIADACIIYLLQPRYSGNLKKCIVDGKEEWTDVEGKPISDHRFLSYAAKYWDKHRDLVDEFLDDTPTGAYTTLPDHQMEAIFSKVESRIRHDLKTVTTFLESGNFRTCLQIQSLLISHVNGASADVFLDWWSLHLGKFQPAPLEKHSIDKRVLHLEQYTLCEKCLLPRNDRESLSHFDLSGDCFRLGTQVYLRRPHNPFHPVNIPGLTYVEEIASRGSIIAVARRRKPLKACDLQRSGREAEHSCDRTVPQGDDGGDVEDLATRFHNLFGFDARSQIKDDDATQIPSTPSVDDNGTSDSDSSINISSDSESSAEAYESWSECSSDAANDCFERDESNDGRRRLHTRIGSWDGDDDERVIHTSSEDSDGESKEVDGGSSSDDSDDSHCSEDSSDSAVSRRKLGKWQIRTPYGEEVLSSDEEDAYFESYRARMQRGKAKRKSMTPFLARLCVYNAESLEMPKEVFSFSMGLELPLYDSPPTIHPTHSLIVWPLSGGKLLFGDFGVGTYFIRKLKSSTATSELFPVAILNLKILRECIT